MPHNLIKTVAINCLALLTTNTGEKHRFLTLMVSFFHGDSPDILHDTTPRCDFLSQLRYGSGSSTRFIPRSLFPTYGKCFVRTHLSDEELKTTISNKQPKDIISLINKQTYKISYLSTTLKYYTQT